MASGAPVVATNLGGMAEAVTDGVNGLLFERGDAAALAAHLARLVRESGLVEQLRQGIPSVKTIEANADELGRLYASLH
jgi:glycosyltransferase involved in cell wall biosynthesis